MRWSGLLIPTLREVPATEKSVSRQLLTRAGFLREGAYLYLGWRSIQKIAGRLRAELTAMGGQEMQFADAGKALAAGADLRSYKQLPQIWYQMQTMQQSWVFDTDGERCQSIRQRHAELYRRVLNACGISYTVAGEGAAVEYMVAAEHGAARLVRCPQCGCAQSLERAVARAQASDYTDDAGGLEPEPFHTPGRKTIADVSAFTGLPETAQMKSLVLYAGGRLLLALLRGDHQLCAAKFASAAADPAFRPATAGEIREVFGADPGSLGPVGVTGIRILADYALRGRRNMIAGANRDDYHLRNVTPGEDFSAEFLDLRQVVAGDACMACGGSIEIVNAIEIAEFRLQEDTGLHVTNAVGAETPLRLESYSLHMDRLLEAAVELHHDKDGMILPPALAPFDVIVTPVNVKDQAQQEVAAAVYRGCLNAGLDALWDDRDERPGVKFKDADLTGIPFRINVGKKAADGVVEFVERRDRRVTEVEAGGAAAAVTERIKASYGD